jgi:hypothetical protein
MLFRLGKLQLATPCLLLLSSAAFAADIQINGACIQGACPPPSGTSDAVQFGQSIPLTNGSYLLSFGDGDQYSIAYSYSASYTAAGTLIFIDPAVTYTGITPSVGNDVINFNFFQNFYSDSPGTWDGAYTENIPISISGDVGAGTTATGQLLYDGQSIGLEGPYGPGYNDGTNSKNLTGLDAPTLAGEYEFTYDFAAGSQPGSGGSSPAPPTATPEPAQTLPLAFAGMILIAIARWRRPHYTA